ISRLTDQLRRAGHSEQILKRLARASPNLPAIELVIRLLPRRLGVEFASNCAEHVLPVFKRVFPSDPRPAGLISTIQRWLRGDAVRKAVADARGLVAEFRAEEELWWSEVDIRTISEGDRVARARAGFVADAAFEAGMAIRYPASSKGFSDAVSEAASKSILAVAYPQGIVQLTEASRAEHHWQARRLLQLITQA